MDADLYRAAFRGSPMKRAKLPAMKRNAAVALGDVGTAEDLDVLTRALDDPEPLVREHAAWALRQFDGEREVPRLSDQGGAKPERRVDVRR
jgi:epoxyqueuosine reductase